MVLGIILRNVSLRVYVPSDKYSLFENDNNDYSFFAS